jgi:putative endonuclease
VPSDGLRIDRRMSNQYFVYIMTYTGNTVLYTGVTNNLKHRAVKHRENLADGFTKKSNMTKLVYFETCEDVNEAISREKQIKDDSRQKKLGLIQPMNPEWIDLYENL